MKKQEDKFFLPSNCGGTVAFALSWHTWILGVTLEFRLGAKIFTVVCMASWKWYKKMKWQVYESAGNYGVDIFSYPVLPVTSFYCCWHQDIQDDTLKFKLWGPSYPHWCGWPCNTFIDSIKTSLLKIILKHLKVVFLTVTLWWLVPIVVCVGKF